MLRAPEPGPGYKKEEDFSTPGRNPSAGCSLLSIPSCAQWSLQDGKAGREEEGYSQCGSTDRGFPPGTRSKPETQDSPSNVKNPAPHLEPGNPLKGTKGPSATAARQARPRTKPKASPSMISRTCSLRAEKRRNQRPGRHQPLRLHPAPETPGLPNR